MQSQPYMPPVLAPFHQRLVAFIEKVRARLREIDAEAQSAYREVIAVDVLDGAGVTGVSNVLNTRLIALGKKVDDAWSKISEEMDAIDHDDEKPAAMFEAWMNSQLGALRREVDRARETIVVRGEADAARKLQELAMAEANAPLFCGHCGNKLQRTTFAATTDIQCSKCQAVTTATAGTAGTMFAKGSGAIALAFEAALPMWYAKQDAEHLWHALRHKTLDDLARWEWANRQYWQAFAEMLGKSIPGWTAQTVEDEVRGKMSQFELHEKKNDYVVRENMSHGIAAVGSNDPNQIMAWLQRQRDQDSAREELVTALVERGWRDHARWVAQLSGMPADDYNDVEYYYACRGD